jgi:hypothetical protein
MRHETRGPGGVVVGVYRIVFGLLALVALVFAGHRAATGPGGLGNFFSYFTIESNILGAVVLCWGGVAALTGRAGVSDMYRGAVVVYLAITGVVYAVLLAGLAGQNIDAWVNDVVHRIMPVVVVLDWLIAPPRTALPLGRVWSWLVFPLLYLAYTLVRGPVVDWYPYPFLDPHPRGYSHVVVGGLGVAVAFVVVTLLVRWVGVALGNRHTEPQPAA